MTTIINQLAKELNTEVDFISNVKVDETEHTVDFKHGGEFYAKLSKDNSKVIKNSVRRNNF